MNGVLFVRSFCVRHVTINSLRARAMLVLL